MLVEAILGARVVVVFADETYFKRWYCLRELLLALSPFDALLKRSGATEVPKAETLLPVIVALPAEGVTPGELNRLPPTLQTTDWPRADETARLGHLVHERLDATASIIGELLDRAGASAAVRTTFLEETALPPPTPLAGTRLVPLELPHSIGKAFVGRADDLWRIHFTLSTLRGEMVTGAALTGAVEGGGGFGKTRLAVEYLHRLGPANYQGSFGSMPMWRKSGWRNVFMQSFAP